MILKHTLVAASLLSTSALAQWNPPAAQWGKSDSTDVRVMSWNVQDALCSTNAKTEGNNNWCACARIVAALKPDVLLMTEAGDNSGNGTGSSVDSVANLTTTIDDFLHGGTDSFHGNSAVTAWVQKYAPGYDLPYVFVSSSSDGFNRNVLLSRFPFSDRNGDTRATLSDIPSVTAHAWAPGGNGGIRGFLFGEFDLPNATYAGDLVVGGAHLKAGSNSSDHTQRITAAQNVSYVVRYWYNGNGGAFPDPFAKIADSPAATSVLAANTPIVLLGDWNEDEQSNGSTRGPVDWLSQASAVGGTTDGTDADGTDMTYDASVEYFTGVRETHVSGSKLDYLAWQDSIASLRRSQVFDSAATPSGSRPAELTGFSGGTASVSAAASDHFPVFADFVLPLLIDCNGNGISDALDIANGTSYDTNGNGTPDECEPCGTVIAYCVPSTSSNGCNATMSASGTPSVAAGSGFDLIATNVEGQKSGLVFYGVSGPKSSIWAPGSTSYLCVKSPTQRSPSSNSNGTANACDGSLSLDFLAYLATHPGAQGQPFSAGDMLWCQAWFRDPPAPDTTNLSDALQISLCP
jgi:endonuclease/exonuclease/phosphatase family metal-dependent hydrolase